MITNQQALQRLKTDIRLRGLSNSTFRVYVRQVELFLEQCRKPIELLDETDIRKYLERMICGGRLSPQTVNSYSAAIRFFFAVTLNRSLNYLQVPRMKKRRTLPVILSRTEVSELISKSANPKHRALMLTAYGSGLRVSELAGLKISDIDSGSMRIFVRGGKGNKDRYTLLSQASLTALREYWLRYRPNSPEGYLFPGSKNVGHITVDAIHRAVTLALSKTNIQKDVSPHTLRHCFATHLLEDGLSLLQIKELLGHYSIQSTTLYLHLANTTAGAVSPADRLCESCLL